MVKVGDIVTSKFDFMHKRGKYWRARITSIRDIYYQLTLIEKYTSLEVGYIFEWPQQDVLILKRRSVKSHLPVWW